MLRPETLCFCIMNLQYVANSCLLARSLSLFFFFRDAFSLISIIFSETRIIWENALVRLHRKKWPVVGALTWTNCTYWLSSGGQSHHRPPFLLPPRFIFNSEVVYFFMIATSVCSQCQLFPPATLCSIIPVLTPKSPWHHSTGCCSNFIGTRTQKHWVPAPQSSGL